MDEESDSFYFTFVLPAIFGVIGGALSLFVSWIQERVQLRRANREMQIKMSVRVCEKIIDALDALYSKLYSDAWHIAWRKVKEDRYNYPEELVNQDKLRWEEYEKCLNEWRERLIGFETELKGSFGNGGYEAFLFLSCANLVEHVSQMVWKVYYRPRLCISESQRIPTFSWKDGTVNVETIMIDTSEAGQRENMKEYFTLLEKLRDRIAILSSTMIHCIQVMNVGNLADAPEPIPEEEREEAEALLGVEVYKRSFEAHKSSNRFTLFKNSAKAV